MSFFPCADWGKKPLVFYLNKYGKYDIKMEGRGLRRAGFLYWIRPVINLILNPISVKTSTG